METKLTQILAREQIEKELSTYIGSENFYRHPIARNMIYTDGIKAFAELAEAYWFIDTVASYMPAIQKENNKSGDLFNIVGIQVYSNHSAHFHINHDTGMEYFIEQTIPYTTLPMGNYEFYLISDTQYYTLLLKSEN